MDLAAATPVRSNVASMLLQLKRDDSNSSVANSKSEVVKEEVVRVYRLSDNNCLMSLLLESE